jgi:hypothetical protein
MTIAQTILGGSLEGTRVLIVSIAHSAQRGADRA